MSQFVFESDLQSVLKLDMPITNAPMPRWQRKASSSSGSGSTSANTSSLTPVKAGNKSLSTSKTPGKTPGKNTKVQNTPSKAGGDRYIPSRNKQQLEVASFLLSKENEPCNTTPTEKDHRKAWSVNLNGYDIDEAKILHLGGKPMNAPEGYQNNLKVLYSQKTTPVSTKKTTRYMSSVPDKILDAPEIRNDFYLNLIDWSSQNHVAVALHNNVYLWNAATGDIVLLMQVESEEHISSVSWIKEGNFLAVGVSDAKVQLWDVESQKRLRNMASHTSRVASLSWNIHVLSSGARSGHIHHHDVRVAEHHIATLSGHSQEVCGLKWSPDGKYLASGANDNLVYVWPNVQESRDSTPVHCFTQHQGAVKALAWCPWQTNILASGGGTSDRHIRIWNVSSGSCLSSLDTESQVCSLVFAPNYKELVSGHGYAQNQLVLWKYPSMVKVAELRGHQGRVLNLALSPDGSTIVSAAADETLRFWKCCALDPAKKERTATKSTSIIHQGIR